MWQGLPQRQCGAGPRQHTIQGHSSPPPFSPTHLEVGRDEGEKLLQVTQAGAKRVGIAAGGAKGDGNIAASLLPALLVAAPAGPRTCTRRYHACMYLQALLCAVSHEGLDCSRQSVRPCCAALHLTVNLRACVYGGVATVSGTAGQ